MRHCKYSPKVYKYYRVANGLDLDGKRIICIPQPRCKLCGRFLKAGVKYARCSNKLLICSKCKKTKKYPHHIPKSLSERCREDSKFREYWNLYQGTRAYVIRHINDLNVGDVF